MNLKIEKDYDAVSKAAGDYIIDFVNKKPASLICFAGGDTPAGTFKYLVEASKNGKVDFSKCKFVSLDEWIGIGKETKGSCRETLYGQFYDYIPVREEQICFFDGLAKDPQEECKRMHKFISENGNLDLILLGIGMNGHIGFNEPNLPMDTYCHVVDLDPITKDVSVKYFDEAIDVRQGISLGFKTILGAKSILLMATGKKKADIVKRTVQGEKTPDVPSSMLRDVPELIFFIDEEAASEIQ